jgi:hypothetical protein
MIRPQKHVDTRRPELRWILAGCCGLMLAGCSSSQNGSENSSGSAQTKSKALVAVATNDAPALGQVPIAVFSTNVNEGHDPFFPDSTRRLPRLASITQTAKPVQQCWNFLKLTGLWPSKSRPLALINTTAIGPGEEASITVLVPSGQGRSESRKLLVRCLEIRPASVLISVEGESGTKELTLQSRL